MVTKGKQPADVLKFFEELSAIPRGSGNEEAAANYIEAFGRSLGLETTHDKMHNVIVKKLATPGYEDAPVVMLQGHSDMVCEKNNDTVHDFEKDPIRLVLDEDGNTLRAKGTTLGADNGTAVAIMMAILQRDDLQHPALECVFTSMEEIGLFGALGLDYSGLKATKMINMDCGPKDTVLVVPVGRAAEAKEIIANELVAVKRQFALSDAGVSFITENVALPETVMSEADTKALVYLISGIRNGVYSYSVDIPGLVLCSGNTGVLKQNGNTVSVEMCLRSADPDALEAMIAEMSAIVESNGFATEVTADFPAWNLVSESPLREATTALYKQKYGKDMKVEAVHGGLECGVIYNNMPGIDIVALGCNAEGAHTPPRSVCIWTPSIASDTIFWICSQF